MTARFIFTQRATPAHWLGLGACIAAVAAFILIGLYALYFGHRRVIAQEADVRALAAITGQIVAEPLCDPRTLRPLDMVEWRFTRTGEGDFAVICERYQTPNKIKSL